MWNSSAKRLIEITTRQYVEVTARFPMRLAEVSAAINSQVQEPRADLLFNSHTS
jgi:hypothetical protein